MISYKRIAEGIKKLKDAYNEDPKGFEIWKQSAQDEMHPLMSEEDATVYVFELSDMRWYHDYECGEGNEWDDENDVFGNYEMLDALREIGIEVDYIEGTQGSGDEAFYVRFV